MAGEYFQLGEIDCLHNIDVPQDIGDVRVRMTYPEYRDSRLTGYGLQTPLMSYDMFENLFTPFCSTNNYIDIRKKILNRVGVWQIECPELRQRNNVAGDCFSRTPVGWHFDTDRGTNPHRVLFCDNRCSDMIGETIVTTRRVFLDIARSYYESIGTIQQPTIRQIREVLDAHQEYDRSNHKLAARVLNPHLSHSTHVFGHVESRPDSVIRHFYKHDDISRPPHIEPYSVLAWVDDAMMHAAPRASGHIASRTLPGN